MTQTYKGSVLSLYIKSLIENNRAVLGGVDKVYYGDQRVVVGGRSICVEPSLKTRELIHTGMNMQNNFETSIIVYVIKGSNVEDIQQDADELTERVEDLLHQNSTPDTLGLGGDQLGGRVIHGHVTGVEHGYRIPGSQLARVNRIVFSSMSRTPIYEAGT